MVCELFDQITMSDNTPSSVLNNNSGIGQGTILGPILFILYINDIVNVIGPAKINMYADGGILYFFFFFFLLL